jgi:hypothetical protein
VHVPAASINVEALYAALEAKKELDGMSWRELAKEVEVAPSTFTRMAQGLRPDTDTFATLLGWLHMPANEFTGPSSVGDEEAEPLLAIASYLRSSKKIKPADAEALEQIITAAYKSIVKE